MSPRAYLEMSFRVMLVLCMTLGVVGYASAASPEMAQFDLPSLPTPPPETQLEDIGEQSLEEALEALPPSAASPAIYANASPVTHTVYLKSRRFVPSPADALTEASLRRLAPAGRARVHLLVQLDFIPRQAAKEALEARGLKLLAYVPDYAWIASVSVERATTALGSPGVAWAGELTVEDKLDPAIVAERWGEWNRAPDGTVAVYVAMHQDERLETGRTLVAAHGGKVMGEVIGVNLLVVEMNQKDVRALAAEDAVQWIEPAAPPLEGANDGSRPHIGVDVLQEAPYNLDGTNVDVLVYDSGQAGDHVDFGTRLTHGDSDFVSEHSTHVAGTVGGSGANSASQGGSALQWRGMAPSADLISYGTAYPGTGYIFYENVPDIEHDWAQAQNTYGADLGTASLGSNVYANYYPTGCDIMGKYGASSVLIDQIVRGGNSVVGIGDKYIATWAAGNERGWSSSCAGAGGGYGIVAPPAAAKNPIHVGGSNTNNTTQYIHTSWGPTEDGRLKPIVTAGGCQTTGDYGIKSTDNNPVNAYTTMCGTSMATPAVAGGIALMLQHYRDVYNTSGRFWPSTAKALLMQTARDQWNPGPDYRWGYGLVDIHAAVDLISRKAFRQTSIDQDEVDVYSLVVPNDDDDLRVSLAWDDHEATENVDPTLINDLDLELVAPDGTTVWTPWVLDPDNPTDDATRDINTVDNQEQVEVPAASVEIGTWLVRVRGTEVPEGPQDYSLACEGCKPLNLGVCQHKVTVGTSTLMAEGAADLDAEGPLPLEAESPPAPETPITEGAQWQRDLEAQVVTQEEQLVAERESAVQEGLIALETARQSGPEAVVALLDTLRGPALDAALDEIQKAQERLTESAPPPPLETAAPVSEAEEKAAVEAQIARDAQNRAEALSVTTDPDEGLWVEPAIEREGGTAAPLASTQVTRTVGGGCDYATIGDAIVAANPGDTLLIEGDVTFDENVTIPISLTLQGGYDGCASGSSKPTTVDGGSSGRVFEIYHTLAVTLENLIITNGNTGLDGGGVRFAAGSGTGDLTLNNVDIHNNIGYWGGGLWVGPDAQVTGEDVQIYDNTAGAYGGGVRLFGSRITLEYSNIHDNTAPWGGGVYATQEHGYNPVLNLPTHADLYDNQALTGDGLGGGLYLRQGTATVANCSDLYSNDATVGGGAYLITSTITVDGSCSEVNYNTSDDDGGGVYAQGSTINLDEDARIEFNNAGTGGSGNGGGAYLDDSSLYSDRASINNNAAQNYGGGVYAINGSRFDMDLGSYTCLGPDCSQLHNNIATGSYGGGVYLNGSYSWLDNTFVENNQSTLGGGIYAYESTVYLNNSLFARNDASSGTGDGVRLYIGSNMIGQGNTFAYNDSGGAGTGQAIGVSSADLTLNCSIIWGHSSSIDTSGEDVTYSDVQWGYAGEGNLNVNPLFVSPASQDYHLRTTSPVIDRCMSGGNIDFDNERRPIVRETAASPYDMGADEVSGAARVGLNGDSCAYATIQQAVHAADDGDTLHLAAGVYFENVDIYNKDITLAGGYNSTCATAGAGTTRVEGSAGFGSTFVIDLATVTLRDLEIAWGSGNGGGIIAGSQALVTLDNADVHDNHGSYGGGLYVGTTSVVTLTNDSDVRNNTASIYGGGVRVWGKLVSLDTSSDISYNCAPHGGGVSVSGGSLHLTEADMQANQAAHASGKGGGIQVVAGGEVMLEGNVYIYDNHQAYDGAGIYADDSEVFLGTATIGGNTASNEGGGVYLTNDSSLSASGAKVGNSAHPYGNEAVIGAGIYASASTVDFEGDIYNNHAEDRGGGVFAEGSTINLTNAQVGGLGADEHNTLGPDGHRGAGIYLANGTQATLSNTVVASNTFQTTGSTYGGGVCLVGSSELTLLNSSIENHDAPSAGDGRGAGIYASDSTVTLDNSQVVSNTAGTVGGGVRLYQGGTLNVLNDSVIRNNVALSGEGGGVATGGPVDINVSDGTFQYNTAGADGGAIYISEGTLDFTDSWDLRWNHADGNGGAVASVGNADVDFVANNGSSYLGVNTAGGDGGALYVGNDDDVLMRADDSSSIDFNTNSATENGGGAYADSGAEFNLYGNVNVSSNNASDDGGAFYLDGGSILRFFPVDDYAPRILVNRADNGGAVYATGGSGVGSLGAEFGSGSNGNEARAGSGGAIYLDNSELLAYDCTFRNGQATSHGGAIYASNTSTMTIGAIYWVCDPLLTEQCSSFYGNTADSDDSDTGNGGAIHITNSTLAMYNTYLHRNSAMLGGAIYQTGSNATSQINNTLVYSNTIHGASGAGIRAYMGTFTMTHTTLANNTGGDGFTGEATQAAHNSIAWGNSDGGFVGTFVTNTCNIDQSGNVGTNVDPRFVDPGAGEDYHLQGNSPAIDACATGLTPDLDNVPRPVPTGSLYDMGAYEYAYAVRFAPDQTGVGYPSTVITYAHTLTNAGGTADTFTLTTHSTQGWTVDTDPAPTVTLSGGAATPVLVSVHVPSGVLSGTVDTAIITATSASDPMLTAAVVDTTTIGFAPGATFAPNHVITDAMDTTYVYTHTLTNTGNHTDTFHLAFNSSAGWGSLDTPGPFELGPLASTVVTVSVTVPSGVAESDTSVVTATSEGEAGPAVVKDTTTAFTPGAAFAPDDGETVSPDTVVTYTHTLTNTGNATDTFHLTLNSSQGWATLVDPGPFTLVDGETETVRVQVTVPPGTAGMTDTTIVTATSSAGADPATVQDTTEVLPADLAFAPDHDETVAPATSFTYTHHLTNTGDGPDTFDVGLASSSEGWTTLLDTGPFTLTAGSATEVRVCVDVPSGAGGLTDVTVLTATSRAGALSGLSAAVTDTTYAGRTYGVTFTPDHEQALTPGTAHTYTHQLTNTGNGTDTLELDFNSSRGWATLLDSGPFTLTAGSDADVRVRVDAPAGSGGQEDVATVVATSQLSPTVSAGVTDTTTATYNPGTTLTPDRAQTVMPPTALTYTHWLTNSGTGPDTFDLTFDSSQGWAALLDVGMHYLDAGEGITVNVRVDVPAGVGGLVDTTTLTATSQTGGLADTATDVTTATFVGGVVLAPDSVAAVPPGGAYAHIHTLTNTGNGPDTFTLDFASSHERSLLLSAMTVTLGADETALVPVSVTVPSGVMSGTLIDTSVVTATSQTDPGIFDTAHATTTASFVPGMDFAPDHVTIGASVDDTFTYTHWLTNSGNYTDTFVLTYTSSLGWGSLTTPTSITLGMDESATVEVSVTVPAGGLGLFDTTIVTAASQGGAGPVLVRDTTAAFDPGVAFAPDRSHWLNPGESYTYTHWLTNTGTSTDTIALDLDSSRGWTHLANPGPFTLASNQSISVSVQVTAPLGSGRLTDVTVLEVTTLNGAGPYSAQVTDTTHVTYTPGVALGPNHDETVPAGSVIQYTHYLTNTGDGADTFSVTLHSSRGWATLLITEPLALAADAAAEVPVEIAVPTDTQPFEVDVTIITATAEVGDVQATATDTTTVACISISNPGFDLTPSTVIANRPVTFTGRVAAGSPPISYEWDFDDGSVVQSGNPIAHTFASTGTYTVVMTVTNICPSTKMITRTVKAANAPDITVSPAQLDVSQLINEVMTHTLTIGNGGTKDLNWNVTETPTRTWLSELPTSGNVGSSDEQVVDVAFDSNGLGVGVYTTKLRIASNDPDEPLVLVPVTMTVGIVPPPLTIYLPLVMRNN